MIKNQSRIIMMRWVLLCCIMILLFVPKMGFVQDLEQGMNAAQVLQRMGRLEEASTLYEELIRSHPNNHVLFVRLKSLYLQMQAYERAMSLIQTRLLRFPDDVSLEIAAAQVHYKMGREKEALKQWQTILNQKSREIPIYQLVANSMVQERLLDEAIDVYLTGRKRLGRADLFVFNLIPLYTARMNFEKATDELIHFLRSNPKNITAVESRLKRYPKTGRVIKDVEKRLKKAIAETPDQPGFRKLLAGVYLNSDQYEKAFQTILNMEAQIDEQNQGQELFRFAQTVFLKGEPQYAEKAYRHLLISSHRFPGKDKIFFGLAQSYEAQELFQKAVEIHNQIQQEFEKGPLTAQSLFKKALIQRDFLFNLPGARQSFQNLIQRFPATKEGRESRLELSTCLIALGNLQDAQEICEQELQSHEKKRDHLWLRAVVHLSDVLFLQEKYDEMMSQLKLLSAKSLNTQLLQDPMLNDGLRLRLFVEKHVKKSSEKLHYYVSSELYKRQRQYNSALEMLDSLITQWAEDPIAADGLFQKGEIEILLERYKDGLADFQSILLRFPSSLMADRALERMGWIYERTGKSQLAFNQYERLIVDYPQSFLLDDIRGRLRRLEKEISK